MAIKGAYLSWITVKDIQQSKQYFTETLGLTLKDNAAEWGWLELQGKEGGMLLGVGQYNPEYSPIQPGTNGVITFTVDDIITTKHELTAKGVNFIDEITEVPGHIKMVSFKDNDGNMFQLCQTLQG